MRVLLTGWFSFLHGEATAGDLLALDAVRFRLESAGIVHDVAWSPTFRPGGLPLADAVPERYTHVVFICGPVYGEQLAALHRRYARCRRIAVGVSVIDPADPGFTGFDVVLARDGPGVPLVHGDLAAAASALAARSGAAVPVTGVALATGQGEYGPRRRHDQVIAALTGWLRDKRCAPVPLDTRLDRSDWRLCGTPQAVLALISRLDVLITTRLHGLVLALAAGVPVLAVDPVAGGGKITAQASVYQWPVLAAMDVDGAGRLDAAWDWCLSPAGRHAAARAAPPDSDALLAGLIAELTG